MTAEPRITINGVALTDGQAMTVRVALSSFLMDLQDPEEMEALGPIGPAYFERLTEIFRLMTALAKPKEET